MLADAFDHIVATLAETFTRVQAKQTQHRASAASGLTADETRSIAESANGGRVALPRLVCGRFSVRYSASPTE